MRALPGDEEIGARAAGRLTLGHEKSRGAQDVQAHRLVDICFEHVAGGIDVLDRGDLQGVPHIGIPDTERDGLLIAPLLIPERLLLDSRVVDVPMTYNSTFVMLSSLKSLFFSSLKNEL